MNTVLLDFYNLKEMENPNLQKYNLTDFPYEVLFNILLNAEPKDIANYCQTSKRASQICRDDDFWKMKLLRDYGQEKLMKGMTWQEQYQRGQIRVINSHIFSGYNFYGIIDDKGDLYMAGNNKSGQLGNGTFNSSRVPKRVPLESKVVSADTSGGSKSRFVGAVTAEGEVYILGTISVTSKDVSTRYYSYAKETEELVYLQGEPPKDVLSTGLPWKLDLPGSSKAVKFIGTDHYTSYAIIMDDGSINLKKYPRAKMVNIQLGSGGKIIDAILIGDSFTIDKKHYKSHMYALDSLGDVYYVYDGRNGRQKIKMNFPDRIKQLSRGTTKLALSVKGDVYTWSMVENQVQPGVQTDQSAEFEFILGKVYKINLPAFIESISTGYFGMAAVTNNGTVYVWGSNFGNKMVSSEEARNFENKIFEKLSMRRSLISFGGDIRIPIELKLPYKIRSISVGGLFNIALTEDGVINYWGSDKFSPPNLPEEPH